jgi:hypothetical protein
MQDRVKRGSGVGTVLVILIAMSGCSERSGPPADAPKMAPVTGTVTYKGQPAINCTVTFHPQGPGNPARGEVKESGRFTLSTYEQFDGAAIGHHVVTVEFVPVGTLPGQEAETANGGAPVPKKYSSPDTSPLLVEVKEGSNNLELKLED